MGKKTLLILTALSIGLIGLGCSDPFDNKKQPFSLEYLSTIYDRINLRIEISGQPSVEYSYDIIGGTVHRSDTNESRSCMPGSNTLKLLDEFTAYMNSNTPQSCSVVQISKYYFSYEKGGVVTTSGCPVYMNGDKERIDNLSMQLWERCSE